MKKKKLLLPFLFIFSTVIIFFYPFFIQGKLPIPADTIVGLYYPFRDLYSQTNPNGLPYKNFLVTDPVRQQYPWKNLAVSIQKQLQIPLWNPYEMAGTPLLANFQSSAYYPLNLLLYIFPFSISWSFFILIQPLLAGTFLYIYLRSLKLGEGGSLLGAIIFAYSGFSIAWLEWGVVLHTALWLPLILLAVDKGIIQKDNKWNALFIISLSASFFAGHLQTFFYIFLFMLFYFFAKLFLQKKKTKILFLLVFDLLVLCVITFIQWMPTLQFILLSNRAHDQSFLQSGWFIPYQNLVQFIAPDFFGNPATLNYFGVWNYGEFVGYVGIASFILALYAIFFRRDKKTYFFVSGIILSLVFAIPNFISQLPFYLNIPFLSTAQPTRLMFIIDVCLSILAALGLDLFIKKRTKIWVPIIVVGVIVTLLWGSVFLGKGLYLNIGDILVSKNNLKLPTLLFSVSALIFLGYEFIKNRKIRFVLLVFLFLIVVFDLFRFGWKFTPFSDKKYLYPEAGVITYLQNQKGIFRIAVTDNRILPPNFSVVYKLSSIEGYDPLYLSNYATFIASNERENHSITPPFGFNRIITPRNLNSQAIDFLNVKYILSLTDNDNPKFKKVYQKGETRLYENKNVMSRTFFIEELISVKTQEEIAKKIHMVDLRKVAIKKDATSGTQKYSIGKAQMLTYSPNKIVIKTSNIGTGFLVLSDVYYPSFHATIDSAEVDIHEINIAFRGIVVPSGEHVVEFKPAMF